MRPLLVVCLAVSLLTTPACADPEQDKASYQAIAKREAERAGLPPDVANAVIAIESAYDPSRIGSVGEIGLMQVRPGTAAMLGFQGSDADLAKPEVNIHFGVTYLAQAWRLASGDLCRALMKYRAGHGEEAMSPLSVRYCQRAQAVLTGALPASLAVFPGLPAGSSKRSAATVGSRGLTSPPKFRPGVSEVAFRKAREAYVKAVVAVLDARQREREATLKRLNAPFLSRLQASRS